MTKFSYEKSYKDKKIIKCRTMINKNKPRLPSFNKNRLSLADKNEIISILEKRMKEYIDKCLNERLNTRNEVSDPFFEDIENTTLDESFGMNTLDDLNNADVVEDLEKFYIRLDSLDGETTNIKVVNKKPLLLGQSLEEDITPLLVNNLEMFPILEENKETYEEYPDNEEDTEDIYALYEPLSVESDDEKEFFDIEAQETFLFTEDLAQSIIVDNDDFIIREVEKYDDLLNLEQLVNISVSDSICIDIEEEEKIPLFNLTSLPPLEEEEKIPLFNLTSLPPLPDSSSDSDSICSDIEEEEKIPLFNLNSLPPLPDSSFYSSSDERSRPCSPVISKKEQKQIINNLLNLNDFKAVKIPEPFLELDDEKLGSITTNNGLQIQKTKSGRFIITEILNSIEELDKNNDIDIFCDVEPIIDNLAEQLNELNLNEIDESFSGEQLMKEYDELNNKKDKEYYNNMMSQQQSGEAGDDNNMVEGEPEIFEEGDAGEVIGPELSSVEEEKKQMNELAFDCRIVGTYPVYQLNKLPSLETEEKEEEIVPQIVDEVIQNVIQNVIEKISEKKKEEEIATQIVDEVIQDVIEKISEKKEEEKKEEEIKSDDISYEEESISNLVAARSLYYGDNLFPQPVIITHNCECSCGCSCPPCPCGCGCCSCCCKCSQECSCSCPPCPCGCGCCSCCCKCSQECSCSCIKKETSNSVLDIIEEKLYETGSLNKQDLDRYGRLVSSSTENTINYHKKVEKEKKKDNETMFALQIEDEEYYSNDENLDNDNLNDVNDLLQSVINKKIISNYAIEVPQEEGVSEDVSEEDVSEKSYVPSEDSYITSSEELEVIKDWSFKKWFFGL